MGSASKLQILSYRNKLNTGIWFNCFSGSQSKLQQNDLLHNVFCSSFLFTESLHSFCVLLTQFPLKLTSYIAMVRFPKLRINFGTLWPVRPHTSLRFIGMFYLLWISHCMQLPWLLGHAIRQCLQLSKLYRIEIYFSQFWETALIVWLSIDNRSLCFQSGTCRCICRLCCKSHSLFHNGGAHIWLVTL